jgi:hypothetical protein
LVFKADYSISGTWYEYFYSIADNMNILISHWYMVERVNDRTTDMREME